MDLIFKGTPFQYIAESMQPVDDSDKGKFGRRFAKGIGRNWKKKTAVSSFCYANIIYLQPNVRHRKPNKYANTDTWQHV